MTLFAAARAGVNILLTTAPRQANATPQERLVELLAGPDRNSDPKRGAT